MTDDLGGCLFGWTREDQRETGKFEDSVGSLRDVSLKKSLQSKHKVDNPRLLAFRSGIAVEWQTMAIKTGQHITRQ